jgi:membrane fusion protein (multidrug efflux system)
VFSIVANHHPWVDANPKETDITHLRVGQKVAIDVDTFPDRTFRGTVTAVSPGTGAQFAILPAQNASGNWVKVVQRVPVRIAFADGEDVSRLRAGMSVYVSIDTGRRRTLAGLLGSASRRRPAIRHERFSHHAGALRRAPHDADRVRHERHHHAGARHHHRQYRAAAHAGQPVGVA